jgi:hypothetical protein
MRTSLPRLAKKFSDLVSAALPYVRASLLSALAGGAAAAAGGVATQSAPAIGIAGMAWRRDEREDVTDRGAALILASSTSDTIELAGHRSHRSHASHYSSSGSGHRSHVSHYSSYQQSTPPATVPSTPRQAPSTPQQAPITYQTLPTEGSSTINITYAPPKKGLVTEVTPEGWLKLKSGETIQLLGLAMDAETRLVRAELNSLTNKEVGLRYETTMPVRGRYSAYVFIVDPVATTNICINLNLLQKGFARYDEGTPCRASAKFQEVENAAKAAKVGIWSDAQQ